MISSEIIKPKINELAEKYGLSLVVLFGSQATGHTHHKSDVDIGVLSSERFDMLKLMIDFDEVFKRDDVEVVDLGAASPTLMYCVVREGKALYERNTGALFRWKVYAIKIWMETAWLRRLRDQKLVEWAKSYSK